MLANPIGTIGVTNMSRRLFLFLTAMSISFLLITSEKLFSASVIDLAAVAECTRSIFRNRV